MTLDPAIVRELRLKAFSEGFHAGADPAYYRRRSIARDDYHEDWRAGFKAGRDAADLARIEYRKGLP